MYGIYAADNELSDDSLHLYLSPSEGEEDEERTREVERKEKEWAEGGPEPC